MNEAIQTGRIFAPSPSRLEAEPVRLPKPQPFGAPVLITDVVTPLAGETVLSLLMKRIAARDDQDP